MVNLALALCGGAFTGGAFELGALLALEHLTGKQFIDYDAFTGISIGAFGAAFLANEIPVKEIIRAITGHSTILGKIPLEICFNLNKAERYLADLLNDVGTNYFNDLEKNLILSATNLNSGKRAIFAHQKFAYEINKLDDFVSDVQISEAVVTSGAVPFLFKPRLIQGEYYVDAEIHNTSNMGLLFDMTQPDYMIVINPLVPLQSSKLTSRIHPYKLGRQVLSIFVHSRLQYSKEYQQIIEGNKVLQITPAPEDKCMEAVAFRFWNLLELIESGYSRVVNLYFDNLSEYNLFFNSVGLQCDDYKFNQYLSTRYKKSFLLD